MDRRTPNRAAVPFATANGARSVLPNFSRRKEALKHLASVDLIELCNEAKVEKCRATRDLRSCGRFVQSILISCGHASLCEECNQRCDFCPICRVPMPKNGDRLRLRLFYECIEAGLISRMYDDRFQEKEQDSCLTADVQRLYTLFDVALENNLVSLICHYVTDVCMDESAVSSDPVIAFLLDEVVVKDWCKRTLKNIIDELQSIYERTIQRMEECLHLLPKFAVRLTGILNVLEVLESSFKDSLSAQLRDLHKLQESISKIKQHLEVMSWCISHGFLENVKSQHADFASWNSVARQRKVAAIKRAWPDPITQPSDCIRPDVSSLFVEDAMSNLDSEHEYMHDSEYEADIASLQGDGGSLYIQSKIEGMAGCYPFKTLRVAADLLFLRGCSDLVVAKQSIFLYYLFDRHWTIPDEDWRFLVDDFAASFGIPRHSLLESLTFYLLDDHSDEALQEACHLLPEISGPTTHPKVARVLLDRQSPDVALMVLRWSGQDAGVQLVSLAEAVTAIRIRVECALLTEAFMYQRTLCTKVKENKLRPQSTWEMVAIKNENLAWENWMETLVMELCCLCIRRNLIDRMIELPWNFDEEKYLHNCLLEFAMDDPSKATGSLLVVFYLQRYRYTEAYQVDQKLRNIEQEFIMNKSVGEELLSRMSETRNWRSRLIDKSIELLPAIEQQLVQSGKLSEVVYPDSNESNIPANPNHSCARDPIMTSLLIPSSVDSYVLGQLSDSDQSSKHLVPQTPTKQGVFANSFTSTSVPHSTVFTSSKDGQKSRHSISRNFNIDSINSPDVYTMNCGAGPLKDFNKSSSRLRQRKQLQDDLFYKLFPEKDQNGVAGHFNSTSSYSSKVAANDIPPLPVKSGICKDSMQESEWNLLGTSISRDHVQKACNTAPVGCMDFSWSNEGEDSPVEVKNPIGGPRWRSDDASDDEEQQIPDRWPCERNMRGVRRSRLTR